MLTNLNIVETQKEKKAHGARCLFTQIPQTCWIHFEVRTIHLNKQRDLVDFGARLI